MGIVDLYSKRQRRLRGELPDVYQYDAIPPPLRMQLIYILRDALESVLDAYANVDSILCREYGVRHLGRNRQSTQVRVEVFIEQDATTEQVLDVLEVAFALAAADYGGLAMGQARLAGAIEECNERFREHGVGYQHVSGEIIRVDSEFIHSEVVKPVLQVLSDMRYQGANEEFLKAHEHYRHGRLQPCLVECLKAFESTMKTICSIRQWPFPNNATARGLIAACFDRGLIPSYLQSQFSSLRSGLESGIPTTRNRVAGHGRGTTPVTVPEYLASYLLHLTATTILFLVEAEKTLP